MILNLTQHAASPEQLEAGVIDLPDTTILRALLTFNSLPDTTEVAKRATAIRCLAQNFRSLQGIEYLECMIGGAPFLMADLDQMLRGDGLRPVYAFSARVSKEILGDDGNLTKVSVFRHLGFIRP